MANQLVEALGHLRNEMFNEVLQVPHLDTAFVYLASVEGASFSRQYHRKKPLELNGQVLTLHPARYKNEDAVRYAYQDVRFVHVLAATTTTSMPIATSSNEESVRTPTMLAAVTTTSMPIATNGPANLSERAIQTKGALFQSMMKLEN